MATQLENIGSLITYKGKDGSDVCLGYLMDFSGHGVYDAGLGKVNVSSEDAKRHNELLDGAMLDGLDINCPVGSGGRFYASKDITGRDIVETFLGTMVSAASHTTVNGNSITFQRHGMTFRGRLQKNAQCFNFRRIQ
jgi:hypothetical protein